MKKGFYHRAQHDQLCVLVPCINMYDFINGHQAQIYSPTVDNLLNFFRNSEIKSYILMVPGHKVDHAVFDGEILFFEIDNNYGHIIRLDIFLFPPNGQYFPVRRHTADDILKSCVSPKRNMKT